MLKECNKCHIIKRLGEFLKAIRNKDGIGNTCKSCLSEYNRTYNAARDSVKRKLVYQYNKESKQLYQKTWYRNNSIIKRLYQKEYQKKNPAKCNASIVKRRARKIQATPIWSETVEILKVYEECQKFSKCSDIKHEVDHIVPLRSDIVCGLHVLSNLQILTKFDNLSKSNRYWPDMW